MWKMYCRDDQKPSVLIVTVAEDRIGDSTLNKVCLLDSALTFKSISYCIFIYFLHSSGRHLDLKYKIVTHCLISSCM